MFIKYNLILNIISILFIKCLSINSFFNIGVMISVRTTRNTISGNRLYLGAVLMALDQINNKNDGVFDDILPETDLRIIHSGSNGNKFFQGALIANSLLQVDPVNRIMVNIGPFGNYSLQGALPTFRENGNIPVISFNDRSPVLGNSDFYPNFLRTVPALYQDGFAVAALVSKYFRWEKVTLFTSSTDSSRASTLVFRHYAAKFGIQILSSHTIDRSRADLKSPITAAKKAGSRIFIFFVEPAIGKEIIEQGQKYKLFKKDTQIIGGEDFSTTLTWSQMNLLPSDLNTLLNGFIGVSLRRKAPSTELKEKFLNDWINRKSTVGYVDSNGISHCDERMDSYNSSYLYQFHTNDDRNLPITCAGIDYASYATHTDLETELDNHMYAYDATISVAIALHELMYKANINNPTPTDLYNYLAYNLSMIGVTGKLQYSSEMAIDRWDIGGRNTEMVYEIKNYIPFDLTSNPTLNSSINITFQTILEWHSENGFPICNNESYYIDGNPCHKFIFQSSSVPVDSPNPKMVTIIPPLRVVLKTLSLIGASFVLLVIVIVSCFHHRRIVRMTQPTVAIFKRIGFLLGFIRVFLTSVETTGNICHGRLWLDHMAFQLIFSTLLIQSWRVYLVAGTMKRVKVSDKKSIAFILALMSITFLLLTIITINNQISVKFVTIIDNQFEYQIQPACNYGTRNLLSILYGYDGLILLSSLIGCWMIRKVQSTVSNTSVLVEVILTTAAVVAIMFTITNVYEMNPISRQLFVTFVIYLVLLRLFWVIEAEHIYHVLAGYELDRALTLRKTEKNIIEILGLKKLSNKILAMNGDGNTISMSHTFHQASDAMSKGLEKYAKLKNQEELTAEINRIKEEMKTRQVELACLENMMFASENENSSQSVSKKSADHRYSYDSGNTNVNQHQKGSEFRVEESEITDIEKSYPPSTPHATTNKVHLSVTRIPELDVDGHGDDQTQNVNQQQEIKQDDINEVV